LPKVKKPRKLRKPRKPYLHSNPKKLYYPFVVFFEKKKRFVKGPRCMFGSQGQGAGEAREAKEARESPFAW
jgi:hypothetical protein